jgi:hypothetical protein
MGALRSSDRRELQWPPILSEAGFSPAFAESFQWLAQDGSKGLGIYLHPLPKMRAAEVRVRLPLDLWEKPQNYETIAGQPWGRNLELYLMHYVKSIFA